MSPALRLHPSCTFPVHRVSCPLPASAPHSHLKTSSIAPINHWSLADSREVGGAGGVEQAPESSNCVLQNDEKIMASLFQGEGRGEGMEGASLRCQTQAVFKRLTVFSGSSHGGCSPLCWGEKSLCPQAGPPHTPRVSGATAETSSISSFPSWGLPPAWQLS